ncbi:hypothetical protein [Rubripirellula obstinata]|nr:hypothetical protein [Rubripirellula obstinata]
MTAADPSEAISGQVSLCPWLICDDQNRFVDVAFRFAPAMTPAGSVPSIRSISLLQGRESVASLVRSGNPSVLLWHFQHEDVLTVLDQVILLANHSNLTLGSGVLPIVACDRLSRAGELALAEIGVSVFLRHPEDLPKFGPLIQAHFASFDGGLK